MTFYAFARFTVGTVLRAAWRFRVVGTEHVPMSGPLIVAANHLSYFDPPALGCALPRPLTFMAKAELFRIPVLGPLIVPLGAYPIERGKGDVGAIRRSVAILREGRAVAMFPEGTRNRSGTVVPQTGVALLAMLAGAPILPAYIAGTGAVARFERITVAFGPPMHVEREGKATRDALAKVTCEIMGRIRGLGETIVAQ